MVDIKMFHQLMMNQKDQDQDTQGYVLRSNRDQHVQGIQINVHLLGKVKLSCGCIWTLNKPAYSFHTVYVCPSYDS